MSLPNGELQTQAMVCVHEGGEGEAVVRRERGGGEEWE